MMISTRAFTVTGEDGHPDTVAEGERFYTDDHELVRAHPDCFRSATADENLREELELRQERIAATQRDREHEPMSAAGRRQHDEDQFWARMHREWSPAEPNVDEDTRNLEAVEQFDRAQARAMSEGITEAWHGRVG